LSALLVPVVDLESTSVELRVIRNVQMPPVSTMPDTKPPTTTAPVLGSTPARLTSAVASRTTGSSLPWSGSGVVTGVGSVTRGVGDGAPPVGVASAVRVGGAVAVCSASDVATIPGVPKQPLVSATKPSGKASQA